MTEEATELVEACFGKTILHTIGRIYKLQGEIFLGNFFEVRM